MKRSFLISALLILVLSQGCEFSMNTSMGSGEMKPIPNSEYAAKGLSSYPVTMTVEGEPETSNVFTFGTKVKFEINNVKGLKKIKGLVYPGMKMSITDSDGNAIYHEDDLLEEANNGTDLSPLKLDASFNVDLPHANNEKYNIELHVWDKKGSGTIDFNLPFEIKPSDVVSISQNELVYSNIFMWNDTDKKVVLDENVNVNHTFIFYHKGMEGFDVVDGMVYPGISLYLKDGSGNEILYEENVLRGVDNGVTPEELKNNSVPVTLTFTPGITENPCHLITKVFDRKNPRKHITSEANLILK